MSARGVKTSGHGFALVTPEPVGHNDFDQAVMAQPTAAVATQDPDGPLHVRAERPIDVHFSFEHPQSRVGVGSSVAAHLVMLLIAIAVIRYEPPRRAVEMPPQIRTDRLVFLPIEGPGGGGGGGGNKTKEPPRLAELPGKEKITVPVEKKPDPTPPKVEEPPPLEAMNLPVVNMAAAEQTFRGAVESEKIETTSQGPGSGGGAGTGTGTGVGSGTGSGLGPGYGGGTGGGAYRPGAGITLPRVLREVKPQYTADAMRAKVQGTVLLECIVQEDGSVGPVKVVRSLDPIFGLDQEAIKAARNWRFTPGMRQGQPVPVIITIELSFTLR
jgi:TonB family protein